MRRAVPRVDGNAPCGGGGFRRGNPQDGNLDAGKPAVAVPARCDGPEGRIAEPTSTSPFVRFDRRVQAQPLGATEPLDTANMQVRRRISSTFKDVPGGQILGPTFDYTHRLLDPSLTEDAALPGP